MYKLYAMKMFDLTPRGERAASLDPSSVHGPILSFLSMHHVAVFILGRTGTEKKRAVSALLLIVRLRQN